LCKQRLCLKCVCVCVVCGCAPSGRAPDPGAICKPAASPPYPTTAPPTTCSWHSSATMREDAGQAKRARVDEFVCPTCTRAERLRLLRAWASIRPNNEARARLTIPMLVSSTPAGDRLWPSHRVPKLLLLCQRRRTAKAASLSQVAEEYDVNVERCITLLNKAELPSSAVLGCALTAALTTKLTRRSDCINVLPLS
jgi:hypothetical protein